MFVCYKFAYFSLMRYLYLLVTILLIQSCKGDVTTNAEQASSVFFQYDDVVHYSSTINEDSLSDFYALDPGIIEPGENDKRQNVKRLVQLKDELLFGDLPLRMSDTLVLDSLTMIGYKRDIVSNTKFVMLDSIFSERILDEIVSYSCVPVYRDILVFKKDNKTVGVAKICFGCEQSVIIGTRKKTWYFGQSGEFEQLHKLLYNHLK